MIKSLFILLLAVGYSLQVPVEIEDGPQTDNPIIRPEEPQEPEQPEELEEPQEPESYPSGECPDVDDEFPVYLSDLKNCSVFYQCANGIPYRMTCTFPLEFNPTLMVCDFPGASGCINDKRQPFRIIGRCPPNMSSGMTKLLRDSEDNTIYYECVAGQPVLRKCPEGTVFTFRKSCQAPDA